MIIILEKFHKTINGGPYSCDTTWLLSVMLFKLLSS